MSTLYLDVLSNKHWLKSQASTVIVTSSAAFFSLWLNQAGYSEQDTIGLLAVLYSLTFLPLLAQKTNSLAKIGLVTASLCLLLASIGITPIGVGLCVFIAAVQLSRDLFYIGMMDEYGKIANKHKIDVRSVVGMAMLLGITSTIIANPLVGYISKSGIGVYFSFLAIIALALAAALKTEHATKAHTGDCSEKAFTKDTRLPSSIHWLCSLSFASNTAMFFVRYFVIPMLILRFGSELGFSDNVMVIAGILISLMTAIGFVFNSKPKSNSYKRHMYFGLFISLISCAAISSISINAELFTTAESIALFLIAYAALEIASKVWTVNFIAYLREASSNTPRPEVAYKCFAKYKALGGAIGYVVAYMALPYFAPSEIGLYFSIFAIGYTMANSCLGFDKNR